MGALGGGLWHTYRGLKNSPKGYKIAGTLEVRPARLCEPSRLRSGSAPPSPQLNPSPGQQTTVQTLRRESPRIGGNFANWGLMFSVFDCSCMYIRQKVRAGEPSASQPGLTRNLQALSP
jgi:import inner membrane translocase subunit TIM17